LQFVQSTNRLDLELSVFCAVVHQVQQTAFRCGGQMAQGFVDTLHGYYASAVQGWYSMFA